MSKRIAIVGTAPSWVDTPWHDLDLKIWSLNDAYLCRDWKGQGIPRADRWFDLHPLDKFVYRKADQKVIYANQVPPGYYVRPDGHLDWLKQQAKTIPVYLQQEPPAGWPAHAQRFPIEAVTERFGDYWASGPSYMVALAILEGATEIHVYGIHLSTQHEYIDQRPNFERMLGIAQGLGITVVMAQTSPVLKHGWQYGYQPKPEPVTHPAEQAMHEAHSQRAKLLKAMAGWPWWRRRTAVTDRLRRLEALEQDFQLQIMQTRPSSVVRVR